MGRCHVIDNYHPDVKLFMEQNTPGGDTSTAKVTAGFAAPYPSTAWRQRSLSVRIRCRRVPAGPPPVGGSLEAAGVSAENATPKIFVQTGAFLAANRLHRTSSPRVR